MTPSDLILRPAAREDLPRLQAIRAAAFAPVFASFRELLGDAIYEVAQARDDEAQAALLDDCFEPGSVWRLHAAERAGEIVGFVSVRVDADAALGEIGLNAVHPDHAGEGIGTAMYDFALEEMRNAGARVATVGVGGDASHAPARRAYAKAGFTVGIPSVWMCCDLGERRG